MEYVKSYLSERSQFSVVNGVKSEKSHVKYGVPQGSILGPNCFSAYVNDMPSEIDSNEGELDLFADDSTVFEEGDSVDQAMIKMSETAQKVEGYSIRNSLTIHPGKCKVLILSKNPFIGPLQNIIKVDGKSVECVQSTKCLGVIIDHQLSWGDHISETCKNFHAKIKKLYHMRAMSKETLSTIYFQGILPSAIYRILIWGGSNHLEDVNKLHIKAARFVMRIKKSVPDNDILRRVKWKPIEYYYKRSIACKVFKIYHGLSPKPLSHAYYPKLITE